MGELQYWKKEFLLETEAEQKCFEEEVDSDMEGGESFDKMNGVFSTEDIDYGGSPPMVGHHESSRNIRSRRSLCRKVWKPTQGY